MNDFTTNIIDIDTNGGYTYEQVMNNKNCSKESIYWYVIKKTEFTDSPRYLFKSNVAESWEFWDKDIINPIKNANQIYLKFKDVAFFAEPSNEFRKEKKYCPFIPDTSGWNKYWDDLEDKIENGFEIEGVRITGRHFFVINFGRFRAIPVDEYGHQISKYRIWTFLRFLDHQYYMMNELEESLLEGHYKTWDKYHKWFPLKTRMDYDLLKLQSFISSKGRRKGWTATIALGIFNYNFTFVESSMNILAAYEKSHYGPMLDAIHTTKSFLDSHTPWIRRTEVRGSRDHFKSSISVTKDFGQKVEEGYLSEIQAISFMDNPFKGIGQGVNIINVEEAGKFNNLLTAFQVSVEPLIRDGEIMIGIAIVAGCVCKGTEVLTAEGKYNKIENIKIHDKLTSYVDNSLREERISWLKPVAKKQCYRIITSNDHFIDCSFDHPLLWSKNKFVSNEGYKKVTFKEASEIKIGDQLMFVSNRKSFGFKKMWNPRLVGLLIGDGSYGRSIQLAVGDDDIYNWIVENNISHSISKIKITKKQTIYRQLSLSGIIDNLKDIGIHGQTKEFKTLPFNIEEYDRYSIKELISGYFDADGDVNYNHKKNQVRVRLTCKYKEMLYEVQKLLYKFNIDSHIKLTKRSGGFKSNLNDPIYYNLVIYKTSDVIEFKKHFTFLCKHKQDKLNKVSEFKKSRNNYDICVFDLNKDNNKGEFFENKTFSNLRSVLVKEIINLGEQDVYNLTADSTHSYITNGFISSNTAGDMESGGSQGLAEMMSKPESYGFKSYDNIYEAQEIGGKSGWFIDDMWYSPIRVLKTEILEINDSDKTQLLLDKFQEDYIDCVDEQGNSYRYFSELVLDRKRDQRKRMSSVAYQKFITQQPKYLSEAFLLNESSPFDTATVREVLGQLAVEKIGPKHGIFSILDGKPKFRIDMTLNPVDEFPYKELDTTGCWVIYEDPITINGQIPLWRYISGSDPIDWGSEEVSKDGLHSFAASYIIDTVTRNIVAEYIGRPKKAEDYFEQLWRGLEYFNALLLYENNLKALFSYFKSKNKLYLLANEPESLKSRWGYKTSNRTKGFHATAASNSYARELIHTWSLEDVPMNQDDEGQIIYVPRMYFIKSKGLLQEMNGYNSKGNFDRISGLGAAMILLFDRTYEEEDFQNKESFMDKGIFEKVRKMMYKKNDKFNFVNNGN